MADRESEGDYGTAMDVSCGGSTYTADTSDYEACGCSDRYEAVCGTIEETGYHAQE